MLKTKMITYNVHDRGRNLVGQDRLFDTVALAKLINGPEMQERVRSGDIQGYYGHWPRIKFGMSTREGGMLDGKPVALPIALRTIHLSADENGNITHQAEFLDTPEGRLAAALYQSDTGGFSSAIDPIPHTRPTIPREFHGFDFVLSPNYNTNRGHQVVLDGVGLAEGEEVDGRMLALLDAVAAEAEASAAHMQKMLDSLTAQHQLALETLERVSQENDLLIGKLASASGSDAAAVLDSVMGGERVAPMRAIAAAPDHFSRFKDQPLAELQRVEEEGDKSDRTSPEVEAAYRQYGFRV